MSSGSASASDARRKAEIEAKKAKLQEIRRQREERAQRLKSSSAALPEASSSTSARKDLDDLVNSLISAPTSSRGSRASLVGPSSIDYPPSPRRSLLGTRVPSTADPASSDFGSESEIPPSTPGAGQAPPAASALGDVGPRAAPELIDVETELYELPQRQRVFYTKEVQTATLGESDDDDDHAPSGGVGAEARTRETEQTLRAQILAEHAAELAARQEEARLERELAQQLRELTDDERAAVYAAHDFGEFVERSTKIVERALTDTYDVLRDYRLADDELLDSTAGSQLRLVRTFGAGDRMFAGRSITAIDWSAKFPELCAVAYSRTEHEESPDGLVAVWNMHLAERPEFVFHAQTDVLSVCFSPFHPTLVVGGTYSGQILVWDTRARSLPVLKTPLSAAGHTHPVYGLRIIGSANAHHLVSASTDGTVCWWMLDMLARPQETLELVNTAHAKTDEVAVTALGLGEQDTTSFLVGSEDGAVYAGNRYDRAGLKAGLNAAEVYRAHAAPVTSIHCHPLTGAVDFSDLFLTSSMDWTARLWRQTATGGVPILSLEESNDYIYDVRWSPTHPCVFAHVDGAGRLDVFDLNTDTERPVASATPGKRALNRLAWSRTGRHLGTAGAEGVVYIYEVADTLATATDEDVHSFQRVLARLLSS